MAPEHRYTARTVWAGAGQGATTSYETYSRDYEVYVDGKPILRGSADPVFRGDGRRHNPEELLVIALSTCHLLEYLYLCSLARIEVVAYSDEATGRMALQDGKMRFVEVVLHPNVVVAPGSDLDRARELHHAAHDGCYIANSVAFPVWHEAVVRLEEGPLAPNNGGTG